jgi:hypothetical protein
VEKKDVVTRGNWKTMAEKPCAIGIEAFPTRGKLAEKMEKPA